MDGCSKKYYYMCNLKKHKKEHEEEEVLTFKAPAFNISLGACSFTISTSLCVCDGLEKISYGKEGEGEPEGIEDVLEKAAKSTNLRVGILL